ncbi:M48 family metalloprotease [Vibrio profundi]|uniref:M48 family metalloprotease n=1 Tax=Vibrio profundi TaxID=1774960 RepID=UPI003734C1EE
MNIHLPARLSLILSLSLGLLSCKTTDLEMLNNIDLGQVTNTLSKVTDLGGKSAEEESEFGYEVAQLLLTNSRVLDNEDVQRYVNRVGQWLVQNSERPDLEWHFVVLDDTSFNAFAAPGGYVFITGGTLLRLSNEAELAGVLAHEIAHVLERHYLKALQKQTSLDLASDIGVLAYQLNNNRKGRDYDGTQDNVEMAEKLSAGVDSLYANGLARGDEEEADRMAVIIAARAGYDPYAYISVLQKIASEKPGSNAWATFMKRHPPATDRLTELEPVMDRVFPDATGFQTLQDRYQDSIR